MVNRVKFTSKFLEGLKTTGARYQHMDTEVRGLGVVVFPSGVKSYFHVRNIQGRPERRTLGPVKDLDLDKARGVASELNGKLADWRAHEYEGPSPLATDHSKTTLAEVLEEYVTRKVKTKTDKTDKKETEIRSMITYVPELKGRLLTQITRKDVQDAHDRIATGNGPAVANRVAQAIRRLYYFAEGLEWYSGSNPARKIQLCEERSKSQATRSVKQSEMPRYLAGVLAHEDRDFREIVLLGLYTLARPGDVMAMECADLDLDSDNPTWTCPNEKMRRPYAIALCTQAVEILRGRLLTGKYVFPSWGADGHRHTVYEQWIKFVKAIGIAGEPQLTQYGGTRHSTASWLADMGYSGLVIDAALGHKPGAIVNVYAHVAAEPVRQAVQLVVDRMHGTKPKLAVVNARRPRKTA
jgi:integrase